MAKPAIKPTDLSNKPTPELPEFEVHIRMDTVKIVRAMNEEEAGDMAWEEAIDNGEFVFDINSPEDEDGAM